MVNRLLSVTLLFLNIWYVSQLRPLDFFVFLLPPTVPPPLSSLADGGDSDLCGPGFSSPRASRRVDDGQRPTHTTPTKTLTILVTFDLSRRRYHSLTVPTLPHTCEFLPLTCPFSSGRNEGRNGQGRSWKVTVSDCPSTSVSFLHRVSSWGGSLPSRACPKPRDSVINSGTV